MKTMETPGQKPASEFLAHMGTTCKPDQKTYEQQHSEIEPARTVKQG